MFNFNVPRYEKVVTDAINLRPQIDDQGTAPEPADSTAEHCTGSDRHRIIADCIGNAVCHTVTDSDRSLRCDIPHGKSCTASGKDHMHLPLIGQTL